MTSTPTVFILGAGASAPYGFPTGPGLVRRLIHRIMDPRESQLSHPIRTLIEMGHSHLKLMEFAQAVQKSGLSSVDLFLEHRPEFMEIGKRTMGALLIEGEMPQSLHIEGEDRWYKRVWNQIAEAVRRGMKEDQVSFVTFNYDRSLEEYLEAPRTPFSLLGPLTGSVLI